MNYDDLLLRLDRHYHQLFEEAAAAIRALLAERDKLAADATQARKVAMEIEQELDAAIAERDALRAERDDFHMRYRMKCDEESKRLIVERDAARAEVADLRALLQEEERTIAVVNLRDPKDIAELARLKGEKDGSN